MKIERTLIWFKNGNELIADLTEKYFGISLLLNRLLNESYNGKKIKFINLDFATNKTYEINKNLPKLETYYYGGHLRFYGLIDLDLFESLSETERCKYVWDHAYDYLCKISKSTNNFQLLEASKLAYSKGIELELNPDYKVITSKFNLSGIQITASIWIIFKADGVYSKLTFEKEGRIVFEQILDKTKNGVEFFLDMYRSIDLENNYIVVRGRKDVESLPFRISLEELIDEI